MTDGTSKQAPGMRTYVLIWAGLLAIVGVEVVLTFAGLSTGTLLASLLSLAIIEAGIAVMYFMHLAYERRALFWSLIPAIVVVLMLMNHVWPDAHRMGSLRP
jgi:cytochrome c oxidase subunit IV